MCVGGVTNGIYTTDSARQVEYIVNDSGTRFFFAQNEEQLDKILEVAGACPQLVKIVVFDMRRPARLPRSPGDGPRRLAGAGATYDASILVSSTGWWAGPAR